MRPFYGTGRATFHVLRNKPDPRKSKEGDKRPNEGASTSTEGDSFITSSDRPRAGVLIRDEAAIPLWEHCNADLAAIKVTIGEVGHSKELVMASVYMPYDSADPPPSQTVMKLVDDCRRKGWELILGCDANAYHTVSGSSGSNRRGRELLKYLAGSNLDIMNK
ncbi:lian-aa1 retrotransposon protein, partial [Lasius niger]